MSQPIPDMSSKEADRLSRLKEDRQIGLRTSAENGSQVENTKKDFMVKRRRDVRKLNAAHLNQNEDEPLVRPIEDAPFIPALLAAILKDVMDLVILALEAAAGVSIVLAPLIAVGIAFGSIMTWCISIFIAFMFILAGQGGKRKQTKRIVQTLLKRGIVWGGFTIVESIPALGVLPLETLMVVVIFLMVVGERKKMMQIAIMRVRGPHVG